MKKHISNINAVICKLRLASIRVTNDSLEIAKEKKQKRKEIIERQKAGTMTTKQRRAKREINLFSEKENKSNTGDNTYPDQANDKYSLQL